MIFTKPSELTYNFKGTPIDRFKAAGVFLLETASNDDELRQEIAGVLINDTQMLGNALSEFKRAMFVYAGIDARDK